MRQIQTHRPTASDLFDQAALMHHVGGDCELLKEIIELFLTTTPPLQQKIRNAIVQSNGRNLHAAAHALRGSAKNFFASKVECATLELEQIGEGGSFTTAQAAYEKLESELEKLLPQLRALLHSEGGQNI